MQGFHGLAVMTLDSESSNPSSSLGGTFVFVRSGAQCRSVLSTFSQIPVLFFSPPEEKKKKQCRNSGLPAKPEC